MGKWQKLAQEVFAIEIEGLNAIKQSLDETFDQVVETLAQCKGRVVVTGIGKSGLVGRKIAATFSSTGTPSFFLHPVEGAHGDLGMVQAKDLILAISNSGETQELNAILPSFKSLGLKIIALTANLNSTLAQIADLTLQVKVPREACPLNLAPTSSTTGVLVMGDALAACLIEKKKFKEHDFKRYHPGGALGQRLAAKVKELMHTSNLPLVQASQPLKNALQIMNQANLGIVILVDKQNKLQGVFTDGDLRRTLIQDQLDLNQAVSQFMTVNPKYITLEESAAKALDIMEAKQITVLPVVESKHSLKVLGVIHLHDLLGKGQFKFST